jgi:PadR family transcriptional regulator, regulatory protein PadR
MDSMPRIAKGGLLQGTLEMLILATLRRGLLHGYLIAKRIQENSGELFHVEQGSLYPALQRLFIEGSVSAEWGTSVGKRCIRAYEITAAGRKQLSSEMNRVGRLIEGLTRIMKPVES